MMYSGRYSRPNVNAMMNLIVDCYCSHFLKEYESGLTPNPDILCNRCVKFDRFYNYAMQHLNVDAICTGHYARSSFGPFLENFAEASGTTFLRWQNCLFKILLFSDVKLLNAKDTFKDQTFFLSQIPQSALRRTMFPLGELLKEEVKQIAREAGMDRISRKKESTGICFVGKRNFNEFIREVFMIYQSVVLNTFNCLFSSTSKTNQVVSSTSILDKYWDRITEYITGQ